MRTMLSNTNLMAQAWVDELSERGLRVQEAKTVCLDAQEQRRIEMSIAPIRVLADAVSKQLLEIQSPKITNEISVPEQQPPAVNIDVESIVSAMQLIAKAVSEQAAAIKQLVKVLAKPAERRPSCFKIVTASDGSRKIIPEME